VEDKGFPSGIIKKLFGFSYKQIEHYDRKGLVKPELAVARGRGSRRLYSRQNLLEFNVLRKLVDHGLPLQRIRRAMQKVKDLHRDVEQPLAELAFYTDGQTIFLKDREMERVVDLLHSEQGVLSSLLPDVSHPIGKNMRRIEVDHLDTFTMGGSIYVLEFVEGTDGSWIARCPELFGISATGKDRREAEEKLRKRARELVRLNHRKGKL
jgi:DNA-binding transcriptional MerR regulator